tara:strand:- start:2507 stop:3256 length:750 start_codon:yes stop_codon:yes gene_type:complete
MLSINSLKKIKSLKTKKGRNAEKLFLIEGKRSVEEYILKSDLVNEVIISELKLKNYKSVLDLCDKRKIKISVVTDSISKELSDTKTPSGLLATCKINLLIQKKYNSSRWLFLYKIKDPGNLGTILRSAAWFNIKNIALSKDCADPYNNKVVRSAMGAHIYINIHQEVNINEFIKNNFFIIGADQNGDNSVEQKDLSRKIVLCLGGESRGFDDQIIKKLDKLVSIKKIGHGESLNVAIAGSIFMNYLSQK